jgi:hypothetical protein
MSANVISVSRRTDVPAFHSRWFFRRLQEGFAEYRNPFNGRICRVSLKAEDVRAFVFWTRNPAPMMKGLSLLEEHGTPFYFLYTINGYSRFIESSNPPLDQALNTFRRLARRIGADRVRWRYDPVFFSREMSAEFHVRNFSKIAEELAGFTEVCIFSFLDLYGKVRRNMKSVPEVFRYQEAGRDAQCDLAEKLAGIGERFGIRLLACCEDSLIGKRIGKARCVDPDLIGRIAPSDPALPLRPSREECGCAASRDIGAYDTCPHGCVYCYANASPEAALRRYRECDPGMPVL